MASKSDVIRAKNICIFETFLAVVFSCICCFSGNYNGLTDQPNCEAMPYPIAELPPDLSEGSGQYLISSRVEEFPLSAAARTCWQSKPRVNHFNDLITLSFLKFVLKILTDRGNCVKIRA